MSSLPTDCGYHDSALRGRNLLYVPYSSSVGAVMVAVGSGIKSLADLKGKKIGVAGRPLDKSWLLLQGIAKQEHDFDLKVENESHSEHLRC